MINPGAEGFPNEFSSSVDSFWQNLELYSIFVCELWEDWVQPAFVLY